MSDLAVLAPPADRLSERARRERLAGGPAPRLRLKHGVVLVAVWALAVASAEAQGAATRESAFEALIQWMPLLLSGFVFNIVISFLAMALGTATGAGLGIAQISPVSLVRRASWLVTQFFRNAPWLVLLFFCMFLLPFEFTVAGARIPFPDWIKAVIGLALPVMANVSEIVRGAAQSIPSGQWEAAASLGYTRRQTLWRIVMPQCLKRMLPPWMNLYAILTMATVLASIVGVGEIMTLAGRVLAAENRADLLLTVYGFVLMCFFAYCYPIAVLTRRLEARFAVLG